MELTSVVAGLGTSFALIAIGVLLRARLGFTDTFWVDLERLAYWILLPALLVLGLAQADFTGIAVGRVVTALLGSCLIAVALAVVTRPLAVGADGPAFTSVFQGTVRFNNYVGLTIVTSLYGTAGLALAALANAVLVPAGNLTSTLALARYGRHGSTRPSVVRALVTNPLVLACVVGLALNLLSRTTAVAGLVRWAPSRVGLEATQSLLSVFGQAALPIGLMCVGAGIRVPKVWRSVTRPLAASLVLRLACVPAGTLLLCQLIDLRGPGAVTVVVFAALPTASSSYLLARRLGGDAPLMASITATQTGVAFLTLPVWLLIGRALL